MTYEEFKASRPPCTLWETILACTDEQLMDVPFLFGVLVEVKAAIDADEENFKEISGSPGSPRILALARLQPFVSRTIGHVSDRDPTAAAEMEALIEAYERT